MQPQPAAAVRQLVPLQAVPAQHALQPLSSAAAFPAALQAAAVEGGAADQRQSSQPPASISRPGSAGAAGLAGISEQQTGMNGGEQHEIGLSQAGAGSGSGQSRRSEAEHTERLLQAVEAAASQGADRKQLQSLVSSFKRGSAKAIINEVLPSALIFRAGPLMLSYVMTLSLLGSHASVLEPQISFLELGTSGQA